MRGTKPGLQRHEHSRSCCKARRCTPRVPSDSAFPANPAFAAGAGMTTCAENGDITPLRTKMARTPTTPQPERGIAPIMWAVDDEEDEDGRTREEGGGWVSTVGTRTR